MTPSEVDTALVKLLRGGLTLNEFAVKPVKPEIVQASHSERPTWPVSRRFKASIKATLHYSSGGRKISALASRRILKNLWVKFVLETDTPPPFRVYWKVVNTGAGPELLTSCAEQSFPMSRDLETCDGNARASTGPSTTIVISEIYGAGGNT